MYQTSVGRIVLCDKGKDGGYLEIGGKQICTGNFSTIFEYNGEKYVVDSSGYNCKFHFRLIQIRDDGSIETIYNSAEAAYYDSLGMMSGASMDAYCIDKSILDYDTVYFLCSGINMVNPDRIRRVQYLLMFDTYRKDNQLIRIDLPWDKVEFLRATSIWSDGMMLSIGCDKQVVMVHLPDMNTEYWTGLDEDTVDKLLEKKKGMKK